MSIDQVLLVAGTHGNEINAPWIFDQWSKKPSFIHKYKLKVLPVIGNPIALKKCKRYIDRDLNRSFSSNLLDSLDVNDLELERARQLLKEFGPNGENPSQIAIDFHSTTASMGSSLVVYGRRPADLALASLVQNRLGIPIYLHEADPFQKGFLVEAWPCGFVVEIGPVPQGILNKKIIDQSLLVLDCCLREIVNCRNSLAKFPSHLIVHRHLKNIDFPRDSFGRPSALIHPTLQGKDWHPIKGDHPLFLDLKGNVISFLEPLPNLEVVPVFINEAAYAEKNIAMGITSREIWTIKDNWKEALFELVDI